MPQNSTELQRSLEEARQKIVDVFVDQCANGAQTAVFNNGSVAACGQFIGGNALQLQQRGIHGTAAALRVLSQATHPAHDVRDVRDLLRRLVNYVNDRDDIEGQVHGRVNHEELQIDATNVIKQSELLYALSRVPGTIPNVETLRRRLICQLQAGLIQQKGWSYFLDQTTTTPNLLPTAYAVLALSSVGEDVAQPVAYLLEELQRGGSRRQEYVEIGADITIRVACLYALAFSRSDESHDLHIEAALRELFAPIWSALDRLLRDESIEQNVEYWRNQKTLYVRVPWQLYLLALAARLRYYRSFATFAAQTRLRSIISQIKQGTFRYPHSGDMVSSRTNGVAYDILGRIHGELRRDRWVSPVYWVDRLRGSTWLRRILGLGAVGLIGYSIWEWVRSGPNAADLGTEFVGPAIIALLALWSKKR